MMITYSHHRQGGGDMAVREEKGIKKKQSLFLTICQTRQPRNGITKTLAH